MNSSFSHDVLLDGVRPSENFILALVAGIMVSMLSSLVWLAISVEIGPGAEYLVLIVGMLIGVTVRLTGHGSSILIGVLASILTLLSSLMGEMLVVVQSGSGDKMDFYGVLTHLDFVSTVQNVLTHATGGTYLFTVISVILAFFIARRA